MDRTFSTKQIKAVLYTLRHPPKITSGLIVSIDGAWGGVLVECRIPAGEGTPGPSRGVLAILTDAHATGPYR